MSEQTPTPEGPEPSRRVIGAAQWRLFCYVAIAAAAGIFFAFLQGAKLDHSAALYLGLPVLLALAISLLPKGKTVGGSAMRMMTVLLLLSAPFLQEGFICIIMAAPILYGVLAAVLWSSGGFKTKDDINKQSPKSATIAAVFALLALEGTHDAVTFNRAHEAEATIVVQATPAEVLAKLSQPPRFRKKRPLFLRLFPMPQSAKGQGIRIGDRRSLHFVYAKWLYFNAVEGDLILEVTDAQNGYVRFGVVEDTSYLNTYLAWKSSEVLLEPIDDGRTKVIWRLGYERKLDPIWYFGPLQYYAVKLTAQTLLENVADPAN